MGKRGLQLKKCKSALNLFLNLQPTEYSYADAFEISEVEGVIRTASQLDREKIEVIRLALICEDQAAATQKQTATATLTIQVQDINDNDPKFRKSFYRRSVAENAKTGTTIVNVVADDVDKNRTITYSLHVSCFCNGLSCKVCCDWKVGKRKLMQKSCSTK